MSVVDVINYFNKKSGVLGLSGVSSDFRDLTAAEKGGNKRAKLAIDLFCYRVKKYIGSYAAAMGGLDAVVFTAGIGENNPGGIRESTIAGLQFLGLKIDAAKNDTEKVRASKEDVIDISDASSSVKIFVIPTNEELVIASDTRRIVENK
jgi:acetate kinase